MIHLAVWQQASYETRGPLLSPVQVSFFTFCDIGAFVQHMMLCLLDVAPSQSTLFIFFEVAIE